MSKDILLSKKQKEALNILNDNETNELLFGGGAGGGKSRLGCLWLVLACMKYNGIRCLIGRNKLSTLKQTTIITLFDVLKDLELRADIDYSYNQQFGGIKFLNGSTILFKDLFLYPSDPDFDSLGSLELTYFFIDECNQVSFKAYEVLKSRLRYKHKEYNLIPKGLLTCNPAKNWVYKEFYDPFKKNCLDTHKKFIQSLAGDNPFLPKTYIESLKKIQIKAIRERLLNGNWEYDDDPSVLMTYDSILDCFTKNIEDKENRYITCDVARKGEDKMAIGIWYGLQLIKIIDLPYEIKSNTTRSSEYIINLARQHNVGFSHIIIDDDGVGGGVVDTIKGCIGFQNNASAIQDRDYDLEQDKVLKQLKKQNYKNLKTQCYYKLADYITTGKIGISEENTEIKDLIVEELMTVKQKNMDSDGALEIIGKDEQKAILGHSPDFADMIMMRMFAELKRERNYRIITI